MTITTVYFQDNKTEDVLFSCDSSLIPNKGEEVCIEGIWYSVKERTFYCKVLEHGTKVYSCTVWVEKDKK